MCRKQKPSQSLTPIQSGEIGLSTGSGENWRAILDFILPAKRLAPGRSTINVHGPDQVKSSGKVIASARVAIFCGITFLLGFGVFIFVTFVRAMSGLAIA